MDAQLTMIKAIKHDAKLVGRHVEHIIDDAENEVPLLLGHRRKSMPPLLINLINDAAGYCRCSPFGIGGAILPSLEGAIHAGGKG